MLGFKNLWQRRNSLTARFSVQNESSKLKKLVNYFIKELSSFHKVLFLNLYIFSTRCCRPLIFQTMNSVRSNSLSLKYQKLYFNMLLINFKFVAKTQFL